MYFAAICAVEEGGCFVKRKYDREKGGEEGRWGKANGKRRTYVGHEERGDDETREGETVADFLEQQARRSEGRGGDVRAAEIVDDHADGDVGDGHHRLADDQGARVLARVAHLGDDREEGRRAGVGEDERGAGRDGLGEGRRGGEVVVGQEGPVCGCRGGPILDADRDGDGDDCRECLVVVV